MTDNKIDTFADSAQKQYNKIPADLKGKMIDSNLSQEDLWGAMEEVLKMGLTDESSAFDASDAFKLLLTRKGLSDQVMKKAVRAIGDIGLSHKSAAENAANGLKLLLTSQDVVSGDSALLHSIIRAIGDIGLSHEDAAFEAANSMTILASCGGFSDETARYAIRCFGDVGLIHKGKPANEVVSGMKRLLANEGIDLSDETRKSVANYLNDIAVVNMDHTPKKAGFSK